MRRLTAGLLLCLCCVFTAGAEEQSVRPGINRYYEDPDWRQWVNTFERSGREVFDRRDAIVARTGVEPGMDVADIGAGTGLFTRLFAEQVTPGGIVYAVDISKTFIDNILREARESGIDNVTGIVNNASDTLLPPDSIDLAFLVDTYHHFEYPKSMLESIYRALREKGRLVVIDFRRDPQSSSPWVMRHVRAGKNTVIDEITAAGFRLVEDSPMLRSNYFLTFEKAR